MQFIDWAIVAALFAVLVITLIVCQSRVRSTADFLAANRCAGRYLLTITSGIAGIGAISIVAGFEQGYVSGFASVWWSFLSGPVGLIMSISGWVYYRLRETRCMTMAQFFEVRYSRKFRIFSGILGWISGVLNYGIFPAVSVKFFVYFCNLPETFHIPGLPFACSTYVCLLLFAIGTGVLFAICGGQIAIMMTDFIQGMFCNAAFLVMMIVLLGLFSWNDIFDTLTQLHISNPGKSLFDPFATSGIKDFNLWFFVMGIVMNILSQGTWQGASGYSAAARSAHEAKMSRFLGTWRGLVQSSLFLFIPICAVVFFNCPKFTADACSVNAMLDQLNGQDISQARVPMFLAHVLPTGMVGLFAAVMFAAMLSTDDTYMHSWGSIFVQDVILPFTKKTISANTHIWLLRGSIIFVGVFAFFFSWLFTQTEYILLFFSITGAIFTGGAGAVVIGGLYSRSGTTLGAWTAMILGSFLALSSIAVQQLWTPTLAPWLISVFPGTAFAAYVAENAAHFPINSQILAFAITIIGFSSYFIVSFIDRVVNKRELFNLDKILHRGEYDTTGEHQKSGWTPGWIWRKLGLTEEFSFCDRILFFGSICWTLFWFGVFIFATFGSLAFNWTPGTWLRMWQFYVMFAFILGIATTVWFFVGGIVDIRKLFHDLDHAVRNDADDGRVIDGKNAGE